MFPTVQNAPLFMAKYAHSASIKGSELRDRVVMIRTNRNVRVVIGKLGILPSLGSFLLDINDDKEDE